jgi:hypothetical protein
MQVGYKRVLGVLVCGALLLDGWAGRAAAQYAYYPPVPPAGYYGPSPATGWVGSGMALDAYANLGLSAEQARIMREQANQAKLDTKKQTIQTVEYERAHKYWYSDEQADEAAKRVQGAMNNPPLPEITSGRAMNTLLTYLDRRINTGAQGPVIPLDPYAVSSLNIAVGDSGGNVGLLRELETVQWPLVLLCPEQKKLDAALKQAAYQASAGPVQLTTLRDINKMTDALEQVHKKRFSNGDFDALEWLDGSHFIDRVRASTSALKSPNVTKVLSGQMAARGNTVGELIENMSSRGMTFGRAQPGQEDAYVGVYRAMVNYTLAIGPADTGFRMRLSGVPGESGK